MKVGICCEGPGVWASGDFIRRSAQASERHGFSSYWFGEHVILFGSYKSKYPYSGVASWSSSGSGEAPIPDPRTSFPDPIIGMSWAAAATTTLEVGTSILILPQRNPVILARELSCMDDYSNGRVTLGVGVGWCQEEAEAIGVDWGKRGKLTDEYIKVMRTLWGNDAASIRTENFAFEDVYMYPTPVRNRQVPILVGGDSDLALKRVARNGDGWIAFSVKVNEAAEKVARLKQLTREQGRDPETLRLSMACFSWTTEDDLKRYREAGFNEFLLYLCCELSVDDTELNEQLAAASHKFVDVVRDW